MQEYDSVVGRVSGNVEVEIHKVVDIVSGNLASDFLSNPQLCGLHKFVDGRG